MARVIKDNKESFPEMLLRMEIEGDHGSMTKEEWDTLKDKWMWYFNEIKQREKNPLLMSWEDIEKINRGDS